jgi:hypothetical protein
VLDPTYSYQGAIVRFSPDETALACLDADDKWCVLESGTVDYLKITPSETGTGGTFEWVSDKNDANPELYAATEGAHVENGIFTFSTIVDRYLFQLDLAAGTYTQSAVPFPFEPDNLRLLGDVVYLCTDADDTPGDALWRWDDKGASRVFYEVSALSFYLPLSSYLQQPDSNLRLQLKFRLDIATRLVLISQQTNLPCISLFMAMPHTESLVRTALHL